MALRDGRNAGELARGEITHANMVSIMVGRKLEDLYVQGTAARNEGLFRGQEPAAPATGPQHRVSFSVAGGEILGMAGLVGAGRSEVAQAIFGVCPHSKGRSAWRAARSRSGRRATPSAPASTSRPKTAARRGSSPTWWCARTSRFAGMNRYSQAGLIRFGPGRRVARRESSALRVKTPTVETRVMNLSGGNQQKVVLAKWLSLGSEVHDLRRADARHRHRRAKAEIYRLMRELAERGVAILMISSDMEEVLGVSDRIAVVHEGDIAGFLTREQFSEEAIMRLAVGRKEA